MAGKKDAAKQIISKGDEKSQKEFLAKKHLNIAWSAHKLWQFMTLLNFAALLVAHIEQISVAKAKGDHLDQVRASVETFFEAFGLLFTLLDWPLLGGGILVANLGGWGAYIHLVVIGDKFQDLGMMWMQTSCGVMFVFTEPWSMRRPLLNVFYALLCIPLGICALQLTWSLASLPQVQGMLKGEL